ncbi:hypothetical protein STEG23_016922 [Scotinomys teguina]
MDGAGASGPYPAVAGSRNGTGAAASPRPARLAASGPRGRYAATSRRAAASRGRPVLPAPGSRLPAPGIVDAAGRPDVRVRTLPAPASARIAG